MRLISQDGDQIGIVPYEEAFRQAREAGLDLVEMAPRATPPVCRILDFGRQKYEKKKRRKQSRKKQHHQKVKEMKFHPNIDDHDYQTKLRHVLEFLKKGDKVKISMYFRGREMAHAELGDRLMQRMIDDVGDAGALDVRPRRSGRMLSMMFSPGKSKN